jgi:ferredoxin
VELKAEWRKIRSFFRNGNHADGLPQGYVPVTIAPAYSSNIMIDAFPVWVAGPDQLQEPYCVSLKELIFLAMEQMRIDDVEAPILSRQLDRIFHIANDQIKDQQIHTFRMSIDKIFSTFESQVDVSGEDAKTLSNNIRMLKRHLPEGGFMINYSGNTPFQLLESAMKMSLIPKRNMWKRETSELISKLKDLLRVDRDKGPERKNPEGLKDALSFVDSMVKFDTLSSMLPESGTESLGAVRVDRIEKVIQELEKSPSILNYDGFILLDEQLHLNSAVQWENVFSNSVTEVFKDGNGCASIQDAFNHKIADITRLFIAKRIGELEFVSKYQPDIHDDFFEHFNWENFSIDEINTCGYFILITDDRHLFSTELHELSTILSSNIPIKIIAIKNADEQNPSNQKSKRDTVDLHAHTELSGLILSHKNIFVGQSSAITPAALFMHFRKGLPSFSPAFFSVFNADFKHAESPFIWSSASIEGRDFPGFTYNGLLGTPWGSRFNIDHNPQPGAEWPEHKMTVLDQSGEKTEMVFPFTFADFASLNPIYAHYFMAIPGSCWSNNLIPLTVYMDQSTDKNIGKVPYIWMVDNENILQKVAVSWPMVIACQERLDFWRFLQENSGINNYHVALAIEKTKVQMQQSHELEINQLKEQHDLLIQKTKEEEAGNVMENLTSVLLGLDTSHIDSSAFSLPSSTSLASPKTESTAEIKNEITADVKPPEQPEIDLSFDPYIDTPLCTSCNECTQKNGAMFKYNADKMAYIADPRAGTFKELVEAAELCPVGIIHPGSPLNPNEENLESLIERASKFN